jgi:hypothetical protein
MTDFYEFLTFYDFIKIDYSVLNQVAGWIGFVVIGGLWRRSGCAVVEPNGSLSG